MHLVMGCACDPMLTMGRYLDNLLHRKHGHGVNAPLLGADQATYSVVVHDGKQNRVGTILVQAKAAQAELEERLARQVKQQLRDFVRMRCDEAELHAQQKSAEPQNLQLALVGLFECPLTPACTATCQVCRRRRACSHRYVITEPMHGRSRHCVPLSVCGE